MSLRRHPIITSLTIVGLLLFFGGTSYAITHSYPLQPTTSKPSISGLLQATNQERESLHLSDLRLDMQLNKSAATKCADMARLNYYEHDAPDGRTFDTFIRAAHPSAVTVAENLAQGYGTSDAVVAAWIKSPHHFENLSDARLHTVGFAVCDTPTYKNMVVQHFSSDL